ncbi:MAG: ATP-binding cassette domain-containing protein [Planctomycetota bacterium]
MSTIEPASAISIQQLVVSFPGCEALRGVDLEVPRGQIVALLGENGAGKTTLIRVLTGFLLPTAGTCQVLGLDPARDALEIRRRVGYVSDAPALYDWMRVGEIGWFASAFYADGFLDCYRETIARFEVPEDRKLRHLSKGQRAKVALALALAHDPELLILDEPTSGLDPLVRREFLESMLDRAATGRSVLLSSHQISEVERVADSVAIIHQGRFRIHDSLSNLRESVREVTVSLDDSLTELPVLSVPAEVLSDRTEGRQRRLIVKDFSDDHLRELQSRPGVLGVQVQSATLEELFAACIRGNPARESQPRAPRTQHADTTQTA